MTGRFKDTWWSNLLFFGIVAFLPLMLICGAIKGDECFQMILFLYIGTMVYLKIRDHF